MTGYGYVGEILDVDLSTNKVNKLAIGDYAVRFLGGRGIAAKLYWDNTPPQTAAYDPENRLVFITGPIAGFMGFSGCRWQICGKSPEMEPEAFSYANLGGSWGSWLKYAGFDGIAVSGQADGPVYILITDGKPEIRDASHLWGKTTVETEDILHSELGKDTRVLSIGPAGENRVTFATLLASENASGSSGFGGVMGAKNLKAIVVKADNRKRPTAAEPERVRELGALVRRMRIRNFEDYGHFLPGRMKLTSCYGCISGCTRFIYRAENGRQYKSFCQAAGVYMGQAMKYYGMEKGAEANRLAGRLCDEYGLDTAILSSILGWLAQCHQSGILNDAETGIPISRMGSIEFIETLVRKISNREGFGDILAGGVLRAARHIGRGSGELRSASTLSRSGESYEYDPRLMLANALSYATEPRRAVHLHHATNLPLNRWINWTDNKWKDAFLTTDVLRDIAEKYWGGVDACDFSTYKGKARASKQIQDYAYLKESLILCDLAWPIYQVRDIEPTIGFCTLESMIVKAITGRETDEQELITTGEKIYNLQRAILMREGWGGRQGDTLPDFLFTDPMQFVFFTRDCLAAGKDGERISLKGTVIDRASFEKLKDEYYALRGWDVVSGLQTKAKLAELKLGDVADELQRRGLLNMESGYINNP
jgi:aldehyde:ferredoxin oxidoreductase